MMKRVIVLLMLLSGVVLAGCGADPTLERISPDDYVNDFRDAGQDHLLLDVRTIPEFEGAHIAGASNIPVQELQSRLSELPDKSTPIVVYCRSGNRSAQAARILSDAGFTEVYDLGGITRWTQAGYELQS